MDHISEIIKLQSNIDERERSLYSVKQYSVFISDKFSDLGLVGAIGIEDDTVDLFSLSCRALGRRAEDAMIGFVSDRNIQSMTFVPTQKNTHLKNMLSDWELKESN